MGYSYIQYRLCCTALYSTVQGAVQCSMVQYSTRCCTVQYCTVQYKVLYSAVLYSTVQGAVQCSMAQYSTRCCTMQHGTLTVPGAVHARGVESLLVNISFI